MRNVSPLTDALPSVLSTLLWHVSLGRSKRIGKVWNWMQHMSFWSVLVMFVYLVRS